MAESSQKTPGKGEGPLYAPETGFSLFLKLFIVPAAIVGVALGIFLLGTLAIQHPKSAQEYLEELRSDSTSRRWQAAYELSRMLNEGEKVEFDQNLRADLVKTFTEAKKDDPRVREYLALVLGRMKEKSAVPALADAVEDESNDVRIYSLWALGNIEDPAGGPAAIQALSDPDSEVQRMAVGALSALRYAPAKYALEANLASSNEGLRYDSAVAIARMKDDKAIPTLLYMMNLKSTGQPGDENRGRVRQDSGPRGGPANDAERRGPARQDGGPQQKRPRPESAGSGDGRAEKALITTRGTETQLRCVNRSSWELNRERIRIRGLFFNCASVRRLRRCGEKLFMIISETQIDKHSCIILDPPIIHPGAPVVIVLHAAAEPIRTTWSLFAKAIEAGRLPFRPSRRADAFARPPGRGLCLVRLPGP